MIRRTTLSGLVLGLVISLTAHAQTVLHVDADRDLTDGQAVDGLAWITSYRHLQDAMSGAQVLLGGGETSVEIWVAEGRYLPDGGFINDQGYTAGSGDIGVAFELFDGLSIYGSFVGHETAINQRPDLGPLDSPEPTTKLNGNLENGIIEDVSTGEGYDGFNSTNVVRVTIGTIGEATLDGLSVQYGNGDGPSTGGGSGGGGIQVLSNTFTLNLNHMRIQANRGRTYGGGIYCYGSLNCKNSIIKSNSVWGGASSARGGGAFVSGNTIFANSLFYNNRAILNFNSYGGAIHFSTVSGSYYHVQSCSFIKNNSYEYGGAISMWVSPATRKTVYIHNSIFIGNGDSTNYGGAIYNRVGSFGIHGSTFAANGPDTFGAGSAYFGEEASAGIFRNTLFTQNLGTSAWVQGLDVNAGYVRMYDTVWHNSSSFFLGFNPTAVINQAVFEPNLRFVDPAGPDGQTGTLDDDYRLDLDSPAIDAGDSEFTKVLDPNPTIGWGIDFLDIDEDGVILESLPSDVELGIRAVDVAGINDPGAIIDIGAYEVQTCQDCPGIRSWRNSNGGSYEVGLNWFPGKAGVDNTAEFNNPNTFTVTFPQDVTTAGLQVRDGDVTFDLANRQFSLTDYLNPAAPGVPEASLRGLIIGDTAPASLTLRGGTLLVPVNTSADIGLLPGAEGSLVLEQNALLLVDEQLRVGPLGDGELRVTDGSAVLTTDLRIGDESGSAATVEVSGAGSFIDAIDGITIESGSLIVRDQATVYAGIPGFSGIFIKSGGRLEGDATVVGNVLNRGEICLFDSELGPDLAPFPSTLDLQGSFLQFDEVPSPTQARTFSGSLRVRIGPDGLGGLARDHVQVSGSARLGGGLVIDDLGAPVSTGQNLDPILSASSIDASTATFDVVLSPVLDVDNGGQLTRGTLLPVVSTSGASPGVSLSAITLDDLLFGQSSEFVPEGSANDAVIGDVTGDGVNDLVIAVPTLATNSAGAIALLRGDITNGFEFVAVDLYLNAAEVDFPTSVEIGDFDANGSYEIAFASGNAAGQNDIHIIHFDGNSLADTAFPTVDIAPGDIVVDLAASEGFFAAPGTGLAAVQETLAPGSQLLVARFNGGGGGGWDSCVLPVDGECPDSADPVDVDGSAIIFGTGVVVTSSDINQLTVFGGEMAAAMPDLWSAQTFQMGNGPRDVRTGDLDNDGLPDIVVINEIAESLSVLRNRGAGDFAPPVEIPASENPISLTLADLDNDGDRDVILVANNAGIRAVRQLRNTTIASGTITLAAAEDIPDQIPDATPKLIRSADLDGSNGVGGIEDDLVILVEPDPGGPPSQGPQPISQRTALHGIRISAVAPVPCNADTNGDGLLDNGDISTFITLFLGGDRVVDMNNDGILDNGDISTFISLFLSGC